MEIATVILVDKITVAILHAQNPFRWVPQTRVSTQITISNIPTFHRISINANEKRVTRNQIQARNITPRCLFILAELFIDERSCDFSYSFYAITVRDTSWAPFAPWGVLEQHNAATDRTQQTSWKRCNFSLWEWSRMFNQATTTATTLIISWRSQQWSSEEVNYLRQLRSTEQRPWSEMLSLFSSRFPGRSPGAKQVYWSTTIRKTWSGTVPLDVDWIKAHVFVWWFTSDRSAATNEAGGLPQKGPPLLYTYT